MGSITVNGKTIICSDGPISIINGVIKVGGKEITGLDTIGANTPVEVKINGEVNGDVRCDNGSVTVEKGIGGSISAGSSVHVGHYVSGNVSAGSSVTVGGNVGQNVSAGSSVKVEGSVTGKVNAGSSVKIGH